VKTLFLLTSALVVIVLILPGTSFAQWVQSDYPVTFPVNRLCASGSTLFACSNGAIFRSTNNGINWVAPANIGLENESVRCAAISGANLLVGTRKVLFLSTNGGTNWSPALTGRTVAANCIASSGTTLFAATYGGVWHSRDNGATWTEAGSGVGSEVNDLAVRGADIFAATSAGLYLSSDNGSTWSKLTNHFCGPIVFGGSDLFEVSHEGLFRSTDDGLNWTQVNVSVGSCVASNSTILFVGGTEGVLVSTDKGDSWTVANPGLMGAAVTALAVSGGNLVAGTTTGIWRRALSDFGTDPAENSSKYRVVGYWDGSLAPENVMFNRLTHIMYAFANPSTEGTIDPPGPDVTKLIDATHRANKRILLSTGGGGDPAMATRLADIVGNPAVRQAFVSNLVTQLLTYHYDGVDLDWEGPTNAADMDNEISLVKELHDSLHAANPNWLLTMAVPDNDYWGKWHDFTSLTPYVDWFNAMTYDYHGSWSSHSGHNAPLFSPSVSLCTDGSADEGIRYLSQTRGIPRDKLVLGLAFYGKEFRATKLYGTQLGTGYILYPEVTNNLKNGWIYYWDEVSQVPYLVDPSNSAIDTFDDPKSLARKCDYAKENNLSGVMIWALGQDMDPADPSHRQVLMEAVGNAMSTPMVQVTHPVAGPALLTFDSTSQTTALSINLPQVSGSGSISVTWHASSPPVLSFGSTPPAHVSQYRWVIQQWGLSWFLAELRFAIDRITTGITDPSTVKVYRRSTEGSGNFTALSTSFNGTTRELTAYVTSFGEFIFGSDDNPLFAADHGLGVPTVFMLYQNYPNPFNPSTTIKFDLPTSSQVTLSVYDVLGRQVSVLVNERRNAGVHEVKFDGSNLASGVYFCRVSVSPLARRADPLQGVEPLDPPAAGSGPALRGLEGPRSAKADRDLVTQERDGQAGDFVQTRKLLLVK
jgi:chitinase